ncbi:SDR family oxidoreductase [Rhodalgimonas zhirmunskyi]|uniref:SDR family oxidoreductase n=1 Tax=Rhodalgimonas zhirmunskyi TaxID=2964767 RepID=A0AAJ1UFC3_9RHOB|nr:SDR family oxidoreductase [Rhodoalgimonas zhirmunskyi]MDQ2095052.1 SDR family oxidoreductase [Rhodoalgimonas zhirmunskyi]
MTRILITGGAGMVGRALADALPREQIIVTDLAPNGLPKDTPFCRMDVTGTDPDTVIGTQKPDVVVHLASIVTPPPGMTREQAHAVDVIGTRNVLAACIKHGVKRLVVTSSGAAYGYHPDNPVPLSEDAPCRGNPEFAYADHKRQVEEMLAEARQEHPELEQVVLRVGTVLGKGTDNQITALFHRKRLLAIKGSDSPFVFIWTHDLARIVKRAATDGPAGIFNVAGDGWLSIDELARALGKPVLHLPAPAVKAALAVAHPLGLAQYGPEQVRFLQYRPVLANDRLKNEFGYTPELTSAQVFDLWKQEAGL